MDKGLIKVLGDRVGSTLDLLDVEKVAFERFLVQKNLNRKINLNNLDEELERSFYSVADKAYDLDNSTHYDILRYLNSLSTEIIDFQTSGKNVFNYFSLNKKRFEKLRDEFYFLRE